MNKSTAKVLFYLLFNKSNIKKSLREIATGSGVSLGSAQAKIKELEERGFIVDTDNGKAIRKRQQLIDMWVGNYVENVKQSLFVMRFDFITNDVCKSWKEIKLPEDAAWGGEAAVSLETGSLSPERWDVYVDQSPNQLIATGRMIPKKDGRIFVYRKFWQGVNVPDIVVYADLIATNDDRCAEAAAILKTRI